jgi:REP element-mobilizing transposase RayT
MLARSQYYPQFFTATILEWRCLLSNDRYKDIIMDSLHFLVKDKRAVVYGFVIMTNHIHLIWHIAENHKRENVQRDFLKFTAQKIKADLKRTNPAFLEQFRVNAKDRTYQIWERNPLSIDIFSIKVMEQKLGYIHLNPIQAHWKLADIPEAYKYSSARFYYTGKDDWSFLRHYMD